MLRWIIAILLLAPTMVYSAHSDHDLTSMVEWIESNSKYSYNGEPLPKIELHSAQQICRVVFPDAEPHADCNIAGYFDHETNLIVISDTVTEYMVEDHFYEVVLLHELVHFLQYRNGEYERAECKQALERDAFELQDQWIDEQGIDPEQKNDPLFVIFVTMCPGTDPMFGNTH